LSSCCPFLSLLPVAFTYNEIGFKHWHGTPLDADSCEVMNGYERYGDATEEFLS
jgi:diadenosine tetraphosphatase ApaH/serine/threonine PP2A family protein phosphatase